MIVFSECDSCYKKATTSGCFTCKTYKIKKAVRNLNEFLEENKSNLSQFILYINTIYYQQIKSASNLNLDLIECRLNSNIENDVVFIIIDKSKFDWGNIGIDFGDIGGSQ